MTRRPTTVIAVLITALGSLSVTVAAMPDAASAAASGGTASAVGGAAAPAIGNAQDTPDGGTTFGGDAEHGATTPTPTRQAGGVGFQSVRPATERKRIAAHSRSATVKRAIHRRALAKRRAAARKAAQRRAATRRAAKRKAAKRHAAPRKTVKPHSQGPTGGQQPAQPTPSAPSPTGVFPVAGPHSYGGAGSRFGAGRTGHVHEGQDIAAAAGTPVVAPLAGTITARSFQAGGAGHYLVLSGTDGHSYVFMHLRSGADLVRIGDAVRAGQQLSEVGSTGDSSGPHLHFEIWTGQWYGPAGSHPIDPLPTLKRWDR